jgi:hypothetical protein
MGSFCKFRGFGAGWHILARGGRVGCGFRTWQVGSFGNAGVIVVRGGSFRENRGVSGALWCAVGRGGRWRAVVLNL